MKNRGYAISALVLFLLMTGGLVFAAGGPSEGGDSTPPAAPTGVGASGSQAGISVSWSAVTTNSDGSAITDLASYSILRSASVSSGFSSIASVSSSTTSYVDTGVGTGTAFYYRVTASDTSGNASAQSSSSGATERQQGGSAGGVGSSTGGGNSVTATSPATTTTKTATDLTASPTVPAGELKTISTLSLFSAAITPGFVFVKRLTRGVTSSDIRELQKILATDPEVYPEGIVSGYYGPLTVKSVKKFQEKHGIAKAGDSGYGEVGPVTRAKLNELAAGNAPSVAKKEEVVQMSSPEVTFGFKFTKRLVQGVTNDDTRELQRALASDPEVYPEGITTGYYGPLTTKAVKVFQEKYGIAKAGDSGYGEVGPATRAKLNELTGASSSSASKDANEPISGDTSGTSPQTPFLDDAARTSAIMAIQAKLQALQQQLSELLAKQAAGN